MPEPAIIINGQRLTEGQAMTVRVAIEAFAGDLQEGLGDDEVGRQICEGYKACITELRILMGYAKRGENILP